MDESEQQWVAKLSDPEPAVRRDALKALQDSTDPEVRQHLDKLKNDPDTSVRLLAKRATGKTPAHKSGGQRPTGTQRVSGATSIPPADGAEPAVSSGGGENPFMEYLKLSLRIIQLDENAVVEAKKDEKATQWALIFIAISGALPSVLSLSVMGALIGPVVTVIFSIIGLGMVFLLAKIFGGSGSFTGFLRPQGLAATLMWVTAVPVLGKWLALAAMIGNFVISVNNVRLTQRLNTPMAFLAVAIPGAILTVVMVAALFVFGFAMLAALAGAAKH